MKSITELTQEEILALSDDDIDAMVKFKLASEGFKIPVAPELPPVQPTDTHLTGMKTVYECAGLAFTDKQDAVKVLEFFSQFLYLRKADYNYKASSHFYLADLAGYEAQEYREMKTKAVYPKSEVDAYIEELGKYEKAKKAWEVLNREYEEDVSAIKHVQEEIHDIVHNARVEKAAFDRDALKLAEYIKIAEGNFPLAERFFVKVYPKTQEQMDKLWLANGLTNPVPRAVESGV